MTVERIQLRGADRARYFAPTAISAYLALLSLALVVTSAFLRGLRDAVALTAAGVFGFLLAGALGLLFWRAQRRDLEFTAVATGAEAAENLARVRALAAAAGWTVTDEVAASSLEAVTGGSQFAPGERVAVRFAGREVRVASICDPGTGFSLVARERCREHRRRVFEAVLPASVGRPPP